MSIENVLNRDNCCQICEDATIKFGQRNASTCNCSAVAEAFCCEPFLKELQLSPYFAFCLSMLELKGKIKLQ